MKVLHAVRIPKRADPFFLQTPMRVVSFLPSATEALCLIPGGQAGLYGKVARFHGWWGGGDLLPPSVHLMAMRGDRGFRTLLPHFFPYHTSLYGKGARPQGWQGGGSTPPPPPPAHTSRGPGPPRRPLSFGVLSRGHFPIGAGGGVCY